MSRLLSFHIYTKIEYFFVYSFLVTSLSYLIEPYRMEPIRIINIHRICIVKHAAKSSYLYGNHIHKDNVSNIKLHISHTPRK
jgi:hypothetical protein